MGGVGGGFASAAGGFGSDAGVSTSQSTSQSGDSRHSSGDTGWMGDSGGFTSLPQYSYAAQHCDTIYGAMPSLYTKPPNLRFNFDINHDPLIAHQLWDLGRPESELRHESMRCSFSFQPYDDPGSEMIARQRPQPVLRPSPALAHGTDAAIHNEQMRADHKAAIERETPAREQDNVRQEFQTTARDASQDSSIDRLREARREAFVTMRKVQAQHQAQRREHKR